MATVGTRNLLGVLLAGTWLWTGCVSRTATSPAEPNAPAVAVQTLCEEGVTTAEVIQSAQNVLTRMHFAIEKLDTEQGVIKTRPLRGAQVFEFWRRDNASTFDSEEANIQSVRRTVELRVSSKTVDPKPEAGGARSLQPPASSLLCLECTVSVQRLSVPENEIAGTSEAYRIHSRSTPTLQRIDLSPQQRRAMAWIDLGEDRDLAARILDRVAKRLTHAD